MCVGVCRCVQVANLCVCTKRPEVNLRPGPLSFPTLPFETEPLTDLVVIVLTWLAAQGAPRFYLSWYQVLGFQAPPLAFMWMLRI